MPHLADLLVPVAVQSSIASANHRFVVFEQGSVFTQDEVTVRFDAGRHFGDEDGGDFLLPLAVAAVTEQQIAQDKVGGHFHKQEGRN